ncbi:MAG: hypothetical protein QXK37_01415 [Candidatus Woesearchaeota archaeon]
MRIEKILNEKSALSYTIALTIVVLIIPILVRVFFFDGLVIGEEPYHHIRMAKLVLKGAENDPLSFQGREYIFDPYDYILAFFSIIFTMQIASMLLPFMCGIASTIIFYFILRDFKIDGTMRFLMIGFFVTTPVFIFIYSSPNRLGFLLMLDMLGFYLFSRKEKIAFIFGTLILCIVPLFGLFHAYISILFILSYAIYRKQTKKFFLFLIPFSAVALFFGISFYLEHGIPNQPSFIKHNYIRESIALTGANMGFSIFLLFLATIGLIMAWKTRLRPFYLGIIFLIMSISILISPQYNIYLNIIIILLGTVGFLGVIERRWELIIVRDMTVFIIVLGILFTTLSYLGELAKSKPTKETVEAMEWLHSSASTRETILSSYQNGFWIEYFANRQTVMDSDFTYAPSVEERYNDTRTIFTSRDYETTTKLLKKYNVRYILIDREMTPLMRNEKKQIGLPFLLENSENFKKAKQYNSIEIWEFLG